jgi:hypothetical protein
MLMENTHSLNNSKIEQKERARAVIHSGIEHGI